MTVDDAAALDRIAQQLMQEREAEARHRKLARFAVRCGFEPGAARQIAAEAIAFEHVANLPADKYIEVTASMYDGERREARSQLKVTQRAREALADAWHTATGPLRRLRGYLLP